MKPQTRRQLRATRMGAFSLALLLAAACGGERPGAESGATPDDVDEDASATVTEAEQRAFRAPADSVLTPQQVEAYLKTTLLQFDLVRREAAGFHAQAQRIEERGKRGGVISGLRNMAEGATFLARFGDVVGGSYVRSARTLNYNPAEMEWVRDRMGEVGAYLFLKPMMEMGVQSARQMREQVAALREQMSSGELQGYTEEDLRAMEQSAEEMERNARENTEGASRSAQRNVEVLRRARPNVSEKMWAGVAFSGGAQGLIALSGLGNPEDTSAQRTLDEWRTLYTDALENRLTAGMEDDPPAEN